MTDPKHKFNKDIEDAVSRQIVDFEYTPSKSGKQIENSDFEAMLDMLECNRTEKDYSWMSDIFLPEFSSIILTDASGWANQYFQSRDFIDAKLDGFGPDDKRKCSAAKKCINQTLNRQGLFYFHKYMRGRLINAMAGQVYMVGWWEQETRQKITGYHEEKEELDVDVYGAPMQDREVQEPAYRVNKVPEYGEEILKDWFNYDVVEPRNVFTDNRYAYSIQEKAWVIIRLESSYEELKANEEKNGYFNLEFVKELTKSQKKTDTQQETYDKGNPDKEGDRPVVTKFDRLLRFGKMWCKVNKDGSMEPGYDANGDQLESAKLVDTIIEEIVSGSSRILIRFQPNPFRDSRGNSYLPIVRGWCYIHPTKDVGLSDGKYLRELQVAINDHFNMASDRAKLSTIFAMKGKKYSLTDNTTIFIEPGHIMELEDTNDIEEFKVDGNTKSAQEMIGMLQSQGQKAVAVYPTTMGELPSQASTTATAIAGAEQRTTIRGNYKSLTFEFTFLLELYRMILNMTHQFAKEETALKMMGDDAEFFDPDADYTYSPVSTAIETEYNKYKKIQLYDQTIGRLAGLAKGLPKVIPVIAHMIQRQLELQGDEFQDIAKMIEDLAGSQYQEPTQPGDEAQTPANLPEQPTSNQNNTPMSTMEESMRGSSRMIQ